MYIGFHSSGTSEPKAKMCSVREKSTKKLSMEDRLPPLPNAELSGHVSSSPDSSDCGSIMQAELEAPTCGTSKGGCPVGG